VSSSAQPFLNPRRRKILELLCDGWKNADIAREVSLSTRTVKWYLGDLFMLYGVTNRTELVSIILRDPNHLVNLAPDCTKGHLLRHCDTLSSCSADSPPTKSRHTKG